MMHPILAISCVAFIYGSVSSLDEETPSKDRIELVLKNTLENLESSLEREGKELLSEIDLAEKLVTKSRESNSKRMKLLKQLRLDRKAFEADANDLPKSDELKVQVESYNRTVGEARAKAWDSIEALMGNCLDSGDLERAEALAQIRIDKVCSARPVLASPVEAGSPNAGSRKRARSSVPPHVHANIAGLKTHRPKFTKAVPGLTLQLDQAICASGLHDQKALERALKAAIRLTEDYSDKAPGTHNSKSDVLSVLMAVHEGQGDLSDMPIHVRDHRKEKGAETGLLRGLPDVVYEKEVSAHVNDSWIVGSQWKDLNSSDPRTSRYTVRRRAGSIVELERSSIQKDGVVVFEIDLIEGGAVKLKSARHEETPIGVKSKGYDGQGFACANYMVCSFSMMLNRGRKGWKKWGPSSFHLVPNP